MSERESYKKIGFAGEPMDAAVPSRPIRIASVGSRIVAFNVDIAIVPGCLLSLCWVLVDAVPSNDEGLGLSAFFVFLVLQFPVLLGYFIVLEARYGRTLGKRLLGLRVVKEDAKPIGWSEAIVRNLFQIVDSFLAFYLIGLVSMLVSPKRQRIGDRVAKTIVVRDQG